MKSTLEKKPGACACNQEIAQHKLRRFSSFTGSGMWVETCFGGQCLQEDLPDPSKGKGVVAAQFVFGGDCRQPFGLSHTQSWPVMWLQGDECGAKSVTGFQAWMLPEGPIQKLELDGRLVGTFWSDTDADYCMLTGILPGDVSRSREEQTQAVFERIEKLLGCCGMRFSDVVRTWFYMERILEWYNGFNAVRTQFLGERGILGGRVPASTGMGARNPAGAALVAGALAVRPKHPALKITVIPSPLQCSASDYRSSFSRAIEIEFPGRRELLISGTASINSNGASAHNGDAAAQIKLTMNVVEAILRSRAMTWRDATRGIVYFRDVAAAYLFEDWCRQNHAELPLIKMHATVCRDDLLFELELDAVSSKPV